MATYTLSTTPQVVAKGGLSWLLTNSGPNDAHLSWNGGAAAERLVAGQSWRGTPGGDVSAETATGAATLVAVSGAASGSTEGASQVIRGGTA